jgi:hypothetical protein
MTDNEKIAQKLYEILSPDIRNQFGDIINAHGPETAIVLAINMSTTLLSLAMCTVMVMEGDLDQFLETVLKDLEGKFNLAKETYKMNDTLEKSGMPGNINDYMTCRPIH